MCDLALSVYVTLELVRPEETYSSRLGASLLPRVAVRTARLGSWHAHGCSRVGCSRSGASVGRPVTALGLGGTTCGGDGIDTHTGV